MSIKMLSEHFSEQEFACRHCGEIQVHAALLTRLEEIRKHTGPIHITSGYRCEEHNRNVGGATNSQHVLGNAADITVRSMDPEELAWICRGVLGMGGGVGIYKSWVHVDVRDAYAFWRA